MPEKTCPEHLEQVNTICKETRMVMRVFFVLKTVINKIIDFKIYYEYRSTFHSILIYCHFYIPMDQIDLFVDAGEWKANVDYYM